MVTSTPQRWCCVLDSTGESVKDKLNSMEGEYDFLNLKVGGGRKNVGNRWFKEFLCLLTFNIKNNKFVKRFSSRTYWSICNFSYRQHLTWEKFSWSILLPLAIPQHIFSSSPYILLVFHPSWPFHSVFLSTCSGCFYFTVVNILFFLIWSHHGRDIDNIQSLPFISDW